ncbi:hypothetical protein MTO96_024784 [Rhipicephalus appendiculatus]
MGSCGMSDKERKGAKEEELWTSPASINREPEHNSSCLLVHGPRAVKSFLLGLRMLLSPVPNHPDRPIFLI